MQSVLRVLRKKITRVLEQLENMWVGFLGQGSGEAPNKTRKDGQPTHQFCSLSCRFEGEKFREAEKESNARHGRYGPMQTEWVLPIVVVPKKDGPLRFCFGYRKLNAAKIWNSYRIQRMEECISSMGEAMRFSTLEARSRYCKVETAEENGDETGFSPILDFLFHPNAVQDAEYRKDVSESNVRPTHESQTPICSCIFRQNRHIFA